MRRHVIHQNHFCRFNLTVIRKELPLLEHEDGAFVASLTSKMTVVVNNAKAWARELAKVKNSRAEMPLAERMLFDAVQSLFMSEGRAPLAVPLAVTQEKALEHYARGRELQNQACLARLRRAFAALYDA
jgi:hypothetical protein